MLFNSFAFIFVYLPVTLLLFFGLARLGHKFAALWLGVASLIFYGYLDYTLVFLILASILFNYSVGVFLVKTSHKNTLQKKVLILGLTGNLGLLFFFKYFDFFIASINASLGFDFNFLHIALPLGISFFTFTQIAFLVDAYRGIAKEYNLIHYLLFVTYFPHLIAGPIIHHKQMMPQFQKKSTYTFCLDHFTIGLSIFVLGLAKKMIIADNLAAFATPIFDASNTQDTISFIPAWIGALSYTFQLYFDFSGYCDMAIGLSKMFNVNLPINFNSPYKAHNIIDFWRRWHMTLSQFLRDYLYIPLGGNRLGEFRRYLNLFITMLLGGLWHGAHWTFVLWGALHGLFLIINHGFQHIQKKFALTFVNTKVFRIFSIILTFICVVFAWVFFRADTFSSAFTIIKGMLGNNAFSTNTDPIGIKNFLTFFIPVTVLVFFMPNTQDLFDKNRKFRWQPNLVWGIFIALLFSYSTLSLHQHSEFLYFQF